jgi:L-fuconolactonase
LPLPWLKPEKAVLYRNFEPAQLEPLLKASGVAGTVVVQAAHDEAETDWLLGLSRKYQFIKGIVGWVDLTAPDLPERLARFKANGPLCGLRYPWLAETGGQTGLNRPAIRGLKAVGEHDLALDLLVNSSQIKYFTELFEAEPGVRWVINHLAQPPLKTGDSQSWQAALRQAASYPNVFCKVSGMVTLADPARDFEEQVRPFFELALEIFGPERLLWGSDWPVSLQAAPYGQVHDLLAALVARLSHSEQAAIWAGTAGKVYHLKEKF